MQQTVKHCITVALQGPWEAGCALPTSAWACRETLSQMTLKNPEAETTGPAWEAENRGCLHFFLLAQNFSFSWDFHSRLSPEEKKASSFWMETENHSRAQFQVVDPDKSGADEGPRSCTWVLETRKHRTRLCQGGGTEQPRLDPSQLWKKNTQSSSDSLSPSRRNWTPRCEKDYLQKHRWQPIPERHPSFWLTSVSQSRNVRRGNRYI